MNKLKILLLFASGMQLLCAQEFPHSKQDITTTGIDQKNDVKISVEQFSLTKEEVVELGLFFKACMNADELESSFKSKVDAPEILIYKKIINDLKINILCRTVMYLKKRYNSPSVLDKIEACLKSNKFGQVGKKCLASLIHQDKKQMKMVHGVWTVSDDLVSVEQHYKLKITKGLRLAETSAIEDEQLNKLNTAICAHNTQEVKRLLTQTTIPLIDKADVFGVRPLAYAILFGFSDIVKLLIESNAQVAFSSDKNGYVPHLFVNKGLGFDSDIAHIRSLLSSASVDSKDEQGTTALMKAAARGDTSLIRALIGLKVQINMQDLEGFTALMNASALGKIDAVEILLKYKADWAMHSKDFCTAFNITSSDVVRNLLKQKGAEVYELKINEFMKRYEYEQSLKEKILAYSKANAVAKISSDMGDSKSSLKKPTSIGQYYTISSTLGDRLRKEQETKEARAQEEREKAKQEELVAKELAQKNQELAKKEAQLLADRLRKEQEENEARAKKELEKAKQEKLIAKKAEKKDRKEKAKLLEEQQIAQQKLDAEKEQRILQKRLDAQRRRIDDEQSRPVVGQIVDAQEAYRKEEQEQKRRIEAKREQEQSLLIEFQKQFREQQLKEANARLIYKQHSERPDIYVDDENDEPVNFSQWLDNHQLYYGKTGICELCSPSAILKVEADRQAKIKEQLQRRKSAITPPMKISKQVDSALEQPIIKKNPERKKSAFSPIASFAKKNKNLKIELAAAIKKVEQRILVNNNQ